MHIFDDSDYEEKEKNEEIRFNPSDDRPEAADQSVRTFLQKDEPVMLVEEESEIVEDAPEPVAPKEEAKPAPARKKRPELSYEEARQRALMKLGFIKVVCWLLVANVAFLALSWKEVVFTGKYWFAWPMIFSAVAIGWQALRVFVLKGRDLRTIGERFVEKMIESELDRDDVRSRF